MLLSFRVNWRLYFSACTINIPLILIFFACCHYPLAPAQLRPGTNAPLVSKHCLHIFSENKGFLPWVIKAAQKEILFLDSLCSQGDTGIGSQQYMPLLRLHIEKNSLFDHVPMTATFAWVVEVKSIVGRAYLFTLLYHVCNIVLLNGQGYRSKHMSRSMDKENGKEFGSIYI